MELKTKRIEIAKGINLNIIEDEHIYPGLFEIKIILPLDRREVSMNALIPFVLKNICHDIEKSWNLNTNIDIKRRGNRQIIGFTIEQQYGNTEYDKDYLDRSVAYINEILFIPHFKKKIFDSTSMLYGKNRLEGVIKRRQEDIRQYSIDRCIEEMFKNEIYSVFPLGYKDDFNEIDGKVLFKQYLKILSRGIMELFLIGKFRNDIERDIKDIFSFEREEPYRIEGDRIKIDVQTKNMIYENRNTNQNRLVIGYRAGIKPDNPLYNGLLVANQILNQKFNSELNEASVNLNNIIGGINSNVYKFKSFVLFDCALRDKKLEETVIKIRNQIEDIKKGRFHVEDMSSAKERVIESISAVNKNAKSIINFLLERILINDIRSFDEVLADVDKVADKDIIEIFDGFKLDTIYFLD